MGTKGRRQVPESKRPIGAPAGSTTRRADGPDGASRSGPGIDPASIRQAVLAWWAEQRRPVAVRERRDPYAVLVAELMAHQTQIERVGEAWRAFLAAFPSVGALAAARPADVLRAWGNLGYNRRALALLRAARIVVGEFGGVVPSDPADLERLPGVGPYTARAVAAVAYGRPVGAVDTNIGRVLARVLDPAGRAPRRSVQALADELAAAGDDPAAWTYALMDLGALVCRPIPSCERCPLARLCRFREVHADGDGRAGRTGRVGRNSAGGRGSAGGRSIAERAAPWGGGPAVDRAQGRRPFPTTRRWLRGRILERLRAEPGNDWVRIESPIGVHGAEAVEAALVALEAEGLVERHRADATLVRLPIA